MHWINLYPRNNAIGLTTLIRWIVIYPVDSAIQRLNNPGPGFVQYNACLYCGIFERSLPDPFYGQ